MAREKKPPSKIDRLPDELMEDGVDAEISSAKTARSIA